MTGVKTLKSPYAFNFAAKRMNCKRFLMNLKIQVAAEDPLDFGFWDKRWEIRKIDFIPTAETYFE